MKNYVYKIANFGFGCSEKHHQTVSNLIGYPNLIYGLTGYPNFKAKATL